MRQMVPTRGCQDRRGTPSLITKTASPTEKSQPICATRFWSSSRSPSESGGPRSASIKIARGTSILAGSPRCGPCEPRSALTCENARSSAPPRRSDRHKRSEPCSQRSAHIGPETRSKNGAIAFRTVVRRVPIPD